MALLSGATCVQTVTVADTKEAPGNASAGPDTLEEEVLAIEDWVSEESMSMPKDTNGTLIQKFNAALQLMQMVSDKVGGLGTMADKSHIPTRLYMTSSWVKGFP